METYVILRRHGWRSAEDMEVAVDRSFGAGEQMPEAVRWIRSYALAELDGTVGSVCVYQAISPEAIRRHAAVAYLPVDEIVRVADTVVMHPDPASISV